MTDRSQCTFSLENPNCKTLLILSPGLISEILTCKKYVDTIANENVGNLLCLLILQSSRQWLSFTKDIATLCNSVVYSGNG